MMSVFNKGADFSKIVFGKPSKGKDGRYFIPCNLLGDDGQPSTEVYNQFNKQVLLTSQLTGAGIDFHLANDEDIDFIKECDDFALAKCKEMKQEWFSSEDITDSYVEQAFMNSLKEVKKQKGVVVFKTRTAKDLTVFNSAKDVIEASEVEENAKVSVIVQLAGLWFTATRFGVTWMLRQVKQQDSIKQKKIGASMFVDDEEDEQELDNVFPDN